MQTEQAEKLAGVFCGILETQAFMFGEGVEGDELPAPSGELLETRMTFSGPRKGLVLLAAPRDMCVELAGNTLGIEPDATAAAQAEDALKELLNVTCGSVLTEIAGTEPIFDLSVPEVRVMDGAGWGALKGQEGTLCFTVDDYPALLRLEMES